jgi:acetyltransferase-like isoleucine patch superfamily enzyme
MDTIEAADITGTWDYRSCPANVQIGELCYIERKSSLRMFRSTRQPGMTLGRNVRVYTWTEFSVEPAGCLLIGDDTVLVGAMFMCADSIILGCRVVVSYNVIIADCDFHPREANERKIDAIANAPFGDRSTRPKLITRPVVIEDDVSIGIGAIILKGVHVGRGARIGAGAIVTRSIPAGATVIGNPARVVPATDQIP